MRRKTWRKMAATGMPMETGQLNRWTSISSREVKETPAFIAVGFSGVGVGVAAGGAVPDWSDAFGSEAPGGAVSGALAGAWTSSAWLSAWVAWGWQSRWAGWTGPAETGPACPELAGFLTSTPVFFAGIGIGVAVPATCAQAASPDRSHCSHCQASAPLPCLSTG